MMPFEINCDMGEDIGNDAVLMPYLDACSVACGGHIGDYDSMKETVQLAKKYGVKIGAHPSFPDREGFGRRMINILPEALEQSLFEQIKAFDQVCQEEEVSMEHIKPHGALYHLISIEKETASIVIRVIKQFPEITLLAPWESEVARLASGDGVGVRWEGFADRYYANDRTLVPRNHPDAVLHDPEKAAAQVQSIITRSVLLSNSGESVPMKAATFCVHGDNPAALAILRRLHQLKNEQPI